MKVSSWLVMAAAVAALALQGCAGTGQVTYADGAAPPSAQAHNTSKVVVQADTKENFEAVVAAIQKQMTPGGRWQYLDKGERATIDGNFADMGTLYNKYGSVDKMSPTAKAQLFADQNTVNAVLTKKDGDRLICKSEVPVGSHLPIRTCRTFAQIEQEQQQAQRQMIDLERNSHQSKTD